MTLSEKIDKLENRIEIIKVAVDGLQPLLPHEHQGAVDTIVVALDDLEGELGALVRAEERAA